MHATSSGRRVAKLGKMRAEGGAADKDWRLEEAVSAHERVDEGRVRQEARQVFRAQACRDGFRSDAPYGAWSMRGATLRRSRESSHAEIMQRRCNLRNAERKSPPNPAES